VSIPAQRQRQRERQAKDDAQQPVVFCALADVAPPAYVDPTLGLVHWLAGEPFATCPDVPLAKQFWIAGGPR